MSAPKRDWSKIAAEVHAHLGEWHRVLGISSLNIGGRITEGRVAGFTGTYETTYRNVVGSRGELFVICVDPPEGEYKVSSSREFTRVQNVPVMHRAVKNPTTPCSYKTAHARVYIRFGKASYRNCIQCSARGFITPAIEWSYNGKAADEQSGFVASGPISKITGKQYGSFMYWSSDPSDYDPLCSEHHEARDMQMRAKRKLVLAA